MRHLGVLVTLGVVFLAPLAVGTVHRLPMVAALLALLAAFGLFLSRAIASKQPVRGLRFAPLFALLVLIPLMQLLPIPPGLRALLDPAGARLLEGTSAGLKAWWPLSLDAPSTIEELGRAAAGLVVVLVACHVAGGRYVRLLVPKVVGLSALCGLLLALGHCLLGQTSVFGLFPTTGPVLVGPFVNPNHAAEFFELGVFASLAAGRDQENRFRGAWLGLAVLLAAGALATGSRASILALATGSATVVFLGRAWPPERSDRTAPIFTGWLVAILLLAAIPTLGLAFGGDSLFRELGATSLRTPEDKFLVWWDSLKMATIHPAGIGRGAFQYLYPVYKDVHSPTRFEFVENGVVQLLIDVGWVGFAAWIVAGVSLMHQIRVRGRKDAVEAALLAGLAAVFVHNLFDFGFETMGIRLPYGALLGATVGRMTAPDESRSPWLRGPMIPALAALGIVVSLIGVWRTQDFDSALRAPLDASSRRALATRAASAHPVDYFYPLVQATSEPLALDATGRSPRLQALNRALQLCKRCPDIHLEVARAMWTLGRRAQAVGEWKRAVDIILPYSPWSVILEAERVGATPAEIARLTPTDAVQALAVARFLVGKKAPVEVRLALEVAKESGAPAIEMMLVEAELLAATNDTVGAQAVLNKAGAVAPKDPRVPLALAELERATGHAQRAQELIQAALVLDPDNLPALRRRLDLAIAAANWADVEHALTALRAALARQGMPLAEVHVTAARMWRMRGQALSAITELRAALLLDPTSFQQWLALAEVLESTGEIPGALDAYRRAVRIDPAYDMGRRAIARLESAVKNVPVEVVP